MSARRPAAWPDGFAYRPHLRFCSLGNLNVAEVMESFRVACERLGYTTSLEAQASIDSTAINLFFFAMGLSLPSDEDLPPNVIVVNFEPALPELLAGMPGYKRLLQRAWVWEYSLENFMHHAALGITRSDYVPLTFEPHATPLLPGEQVLPDEAQDIDVIFFGETMPRRLAVLRALQAKGLRVAYPIGTAWTPAERDVLLPRAKVGLNMRKADHTSTAEVPRLSILLRNRKAVVSELYPHSEIPAALRDAVDGCAFDELVNRVQALLADAPRRRAMEQGAPHALLKLVPQADVLDGALRRYVVATQQRLAALQAVSSAKPAVEVSVLMVTRNDATVIDACLDAIAAQTLAPHRIVVVDDASTDGTALRIRQRMRLDARLSGVVLLEEPVAMGWAAAAQWGLAHASGDALAMWSPHTLAHATRLQVQAAFMQACPVIGAVGMAAARSEAVGGDRLSSSPAMHEQILAGLLVHLPSDRHPLLMGSMMVSLREVRRLGLGFDATLGRFAWIGLLLGLVQEGSRLANLHVELTHPAAPQDESVTTADVVALHHLRKRLIPLVFPALSFADAHRLARLYGLEWAPDAKDATKLLNDIAHACSQQADVHAATALRGECLRVLDVYASNGRLKPGYIRDLMAQPALRDFLAPLGERIDNREASGI